MVNETVLELKTGESRDLFLREKDEKFEAILGERSYLHLFLEPDFSGDVFIRLKGDASRVKVRGLAIGKGNEQISRHITIVHEGKSTASEQIFKNIIFDEATITTDSLVKIEEKAVKSEAGQLIKNLLLSAKAKVVSNPHLTIKNRDVVAHHGATSGAPDEQALLYLESRGMSKKEAKKALIASFLQEIISLIPIASERKLLEKSISKILA